MHAHAHLDTTEFVARLLLAVCELFADDNADINFALVSFTAASLFNFYPENPTFRQLHADCDVYKGP